MSIRIKGDLRSAFEKLKEIMKPEIWVPVASNLPENGTVVDTKIHDTKGPRNEGRLKRQDNLWFTEDGKMYVYYTPTHWRYIKTDKP